MLIMPMTSRNFQNMADRIADDFFRRGVSIADGVVKVATASDMTPEEVRRLVEKSNSAAAVRFLKSAEDKKASFALASVDEVLSRTHPVEDEDEPDEPVVKTAELPYSREQRDVPLFSGVQRQVKQAAEEDGAPDVHDLLTLRMQVEKARQGRVAAELALMKAVNHLVALWHKGDEDCGQLAADAAELYGPKATAVAKVVGEISGQTPEPCEPSAVIDDTSENLVPFKVAVDALDHIAESDKICQAADAALQAHFPGSPL